MRSVSAGLDLSRRHRDLQQSRPNPWRHPLAWSQHRIDEWVLRRVKRQPGPISIGRQKIYIVPTRFGYGFALMCIVMLLGAMNYSNSMAFVLCFFLAALALVCMHHTHANLAHLQLRAGAVAPVFRNETAHFEILLSNPSARPRYSVALHWAGTDTEPTHDDVPAKAQTAMLLPLLADQRGWLKSSVVSISTEFPLGLFHAWSLFELDQAALVYPAPGPTRLTPPEHHHQGGERSGKIGGQDEFAGLRGYQRGDSTRLIHWKSWPKSQTLMVKQFNETTGMQLWLDWNTLPHLQPEARLSQLTRWVLEAEADTSGQHYGLRLPDETLTPARGAPHRDACLRALALYGL